MADDLSELEKKTPEELAADPEIHKAMLTFAEEVAEYWRSISPVGEPPDDKHPGLYRDSIAVGEKGDDVFVRADSYTAHWIEYGTVDTPEFAPAAKTQDYFNSGAATGFNITKKAKQTRAQRKDARAAKSAARKAARAKKTT